MSGSVCRRHSDQRFPRKGGREGRMVAFWLPCSRSAQIFPRPPPSPNVLSERKPEIPTQTEISRPHSSVSGRRFARTRNGVPESSFSRICDRVMDIVPSLEERLLRSRVGRSDLIRFFLSFFFLFLDDGEIGIKGDATKGLAIRAVSPRSSSLTLPRPAE